MNNPYAPWTNAQTTLFYQQIIGYGEYKWWLLILLSELMLKMQWRTG
jgi:hypothetical protein